MGQTSTTLNDATGFDITKVLSLEWWLQHLHDAYVTNPYHMITELVLIVFIIWLIFKHAEKSPTDKKSQLTLWEEEELIREWSPEPLIPEEMNKWSKKNKRLQVNSVVGATVNTEEGQTLVHLASHNYLGLSNHERVREAAADTIKKYAVGSCGPRGFYGTMDIHLDLEKELGEYFGNHAIIYPDYMGCAPSVLTAFSKRGDLLVIDSGCHFLITQGAVLSRSNVLWYPHNDMVELEMILQNIAEDDTRHPSKQLHRRFIVTEGVFHHHGDICHLPDIIRLKELFKYRLILDDSHGFGSLHQKGSLGYWNIPTEKVDVYLSSMDTALGGTGAFCLGSEEITYHQTLSGSGYVFTASSPPFQVSGCHEALKMIADPTISGPRIEKLHNNAVLMRDALEDEHGRWRCGEDRKVPLIHLRLRDYTREDAADIFEAVSFLARNEGVLVFPNAYLPQEYDIAEKGNPVPSLRICVTAEHSEKQLTDSARVICGLLNDFLRGTRNAKEVVAMQGKSEEDVE